MPTTHIAVILDKSGSMQSVKVETITGFNDYLRKLREDPAAGDMRLTLTLFDTTCQTPVVAEPVANVNDLDDTRYQPAGYTALYDAVRETVLKTEASGKIQPEDRVLVVMITDGQENSSRDATKAEILQIIRDREALGNWSFAYLSAAPSAFADAQAIGVSPGNAAAYAATGTGTKAAFRGVALATSDYSRSARLSTDSLFADAGIGHIIDDPGRIEPAPSSVNTWVGRKPGSSVGATSWTKV